LTNTALYQARVTSFHCPTICIRSNLSRNADYDRIVLITMKVFQ